MSGYSSRAGDGEGGGRRLHLALALDGRGDEPGRLAQHRLELLRDGVLRLDTNSRVNTGFRTNFDSTRFE